MTLAEFTEDFPWGVPTEEGYSFIWQMQKFRPNAEVDNNIDLQENWV